MAAPQAVPEPGGADAGVDAIMNIAEQGRSGETAKVPTIGTFLEFHEPGLSQAEEKDEALKPHHGLMQPIPESPDTLKGGTLWQDQPSTQNSMEDPEQQAHDNVAEKHLLPPPPDRDSVHSHEHPQHDSRQSPGAAERHHDRRQSLSNDLEHHHSNQPSSAVEHNPRRKSIISDHDDDHHHHHHHHHHHKHEHHGEHEIRPSHHDGHQEHHGGSGKKWAMAGSDRAVASPAVSKSHHDDERRLAHAASNLFKDAQWGKKKPMAQVFAESQRSMASHHSDASDRERQHSHRSHRPDSGSPVATGLRGSPYHTTLRTPRNDQKDDSGERQDDGEETGEEVFGNDVLGVVEVVDGQVTQRNQMDEHSDYEDEGPHPHRRRGGYCACLPCCYADDEPVDIPDPNCWGCTTDGRFRTLFMRIAINKYVERVWLANSVAHTVILLVEQHEVSFTSPEWTEAIFMSVYLLELVIKGTAWGMWGGRYAYLNYDVFNRIDFLVTVSSVGEFIALQFGKEFSLRGFRLCRLLRPLLKTDVFQDIGSILSTLEIGAVALFTVIYLMLFVFVLFGVVGMAAYSSSFSRRCVWADTMEIKLPEQWCKRFDDDAPLLGLHSSCGAMQVCLSVGDPSYGFTHFDHMGAAMMAIFQAFSTDGQYAIMWATLQAEPAYAPITLIYWMSVGFILGQILVNVFLAVLASVFTRVREEQEPAAEPPEADPEQQPPPPIRDYQSSSHSSHGHPPAGSNTVSPMRTPVSAAGSHTSNTYRPPHNPLASVNMRSQAPHPIEPNGRRGGLASMRPQTLAMPEGGVKNLVSTTGVGGNGVHGSHFGLEGDRDDWSWAELEPTLVEGAQFGNGDTGARRDFSPELFTSMQGQMAESARAGPEAMRGRHARRASHDSSSRRLSHGGSDGLRRESLSSPRSHRHVASHDGLLSRDWTPRRLELSPVPAAATRSKPKYLPSPRKGFEDHVEKSNSSFGEKLSVIFRSQPFEVIVLLAILGNSAVLAMVGYVEGIDWELELAELVFSIFFTVELALQILCDGSLSKYFESGEHIFDFVTVAPTVIKLVTQLAGAREGSKVVEFLSALGIVRLLRACKYFFLRPLWLMLIKAASSWVPAFNLVLFIMVFMSAWTILGRALFEDKLDNSRANFDTFLKGFLTLFQVFTGDSWTAVLYDGMQSSCSDIPEYDASCLINGGFCTTCETGMAVVYAWYYILFFWMGQYVFITMFLALILEKFSVHEFMTIGSVNIQDIYLTREEALGAVAEYQRLPVALVSERLVNAAFTINVANSRTNPSATISKLALIKFVKRKQPKRLWRLVNFLGLALARRWLRENIFCCFGFLKCCRPWPGDPDWGKVAAAVEEEEARETDPAVLEIQFAHRMAHRIRDHMHKLVQTGMAGEVRMVCARLGLEEQVSPDLVSTPPEVAIKVLKDKAILQRLGFNDLDGLFASDLVAEKQDLSKKLDKMDKTNRGIERSGSDNLELSEAEEGLDESMDALVMDELVEQRGRLQNFNLLRAVERGLILLSNHPFFDVVVYSCIITGSVFLAMETPAAEIPGPLPRSVSDLTAYLFTGVFMLEAMAKISAFGFFMPKDVEYEAYWQDGWNRLDFIVLLFSIADLANRFTGSTLVGADTARVIRVSRALRPLRLMGRNKGMKTIISALIGSTKPIFYATLFLFMITTVFAVLGMSLFKDSFGSCNDGSLDGSLGEGRFECLGTLKRDDALLIPRVWVNPNSNFDTFPKAIQTLCRVFTLKWVSVWYLAMDATGPGIQPVENTNVAMGSMFFVLFIFVGSFFSLNLFVSFIVDGFYAAQGVDSQFDEIQYASVNKLVYEMWPKRFVKPPMNMLSLLCRGLVMSVWFKMFSGLCLLTNIVCMTLAHEGASEGFLHFLSVQNDVFFAIMCVELLLTIVAWGPKIFLADAGYVFDLFLVFATMITMLLADTFRGASQGVRVLRLVRFLRMMQSNSIVESVFETVLLSLKQVANVLVVIFLVMSVFAVVGVSSYGTTKFGERLGTQANFKSYPWAMMTLFQIMFGEEWHVLMDDCLVQPPYCTKRFVNEATGEELSYGDCGSAFAPAYFLAFIVICNFTMINLFVGMIINNFAFCSNKEIHGVVTPAHVEHLSATWVNKVDEDATAFVPLTKVYKLMLYLGEPMGFYGTDGNVGRFLCVREDLRKVLEEAAETDAPKTAGERLLAWFRVVETRLADERYEEWRIMQEEAAAWEVEQIQKQKDKQQRHQGGDEEGAEGENGSEEGDGDEGKSDGMSDEDGKVSEEEEDDDANEEDAFRAARRRKAGRRKGGTVSGGRFGNERGAEEGEVRVSGGNMGQREKKGRRRGSAADEVERGKGGAARYEEAERRREQAAKWEWVEQVKKMHKPRKTLMMHLVGLGRWVVQQTLVSKQRTYYRPPQMLRYDEVVQALLYWNKKDSIVPKRIAEDRRERDGDIIQNVAAQLIAAVVKGAAFRRRKKKMSEQKQRLRLFAKHGRVGSVPKLQQAPAEPDPVEKVAAEQELMEARAGELLRSEALEPGATKEVIATLVAQRRILYAELQRAAAEVGVEASGEEGVFGLEEVDLEPLLSHPAVAERVKEHRAREDVEMLLGAGYGAMLREAAAEVGVELPAMASERWQSLDAGLLQKLLRVERVRVRVAILRATSNEEKDAGHRGKPRGEGQGDRASERKKSVVGAPGSAALAKAAEEKAAENERLRGQVERERREKAELAKVLEETQKRYQAARRAEEVSKERVEEEKRERETIQAKYDLSQAQASANAAQKANAERLAAKDRGRGPEAEAPAVAGSGWRRKKDDPWGMQNAAPTPASRSPLAAPAASFPAGSPLPGAPRQAPSPLPPPPVAPPPEAIGDPQRPAAESLSQQEAPQPILPGQVAETEDGGEGDGGGRAQTGGAEGGAGGAAEGRGGRGGAGAGGGTKKAESFKAVTAAELVAARGGGAKEEEVALQDALAIKKAELERIERLLTKVQAQKRAEKKAEELEASGHGKAGQRQAASAFDPNTTASLSTAAAMGFDVLVKKPAASPAKKSKQPSWL